MMSGFSFGRGYGQDEKRYREQKEKLTTTGCDTFNDYVYCVFPLIFGNWGEKVNLDLAEELALNYQAELEKIEPQTEGDEYYEWLKKYGMVQILLGTVYAYKKEYLKSAYHFIKGLKTEEVELSMPYCDFIKYIIKKLEGMECETLEYTGCGSNAQEPMGSVKGDGLVARLSTTLIANLEGENGELILAKEGRSGTYGFIARRGSTFTLTSDQIIDIYETYIVDKEYKVKKIKFYVNGYFGNGKPQIRLPNGFRFLKSSLIKYNCEVIE
jgi:hypothetical protein